MDTLGHAELRQRPTATGDGHRPRRSALALSTNQSRERLQGKLAHRLRDWKNQNEPMLSREQAAAIFDRIKKLSSSDEVEVLFSGGKFALPRFANNTIHQNVEEENHVVSVRTVFSGRTARATTNKFDDDSLRRVVESSEALAKVQHPDPDLLLMPDSREAAGGTLHLGSGQAHESPVPTLSVPTR